MKGKNILITGGAGFIGSHLVDRLIDNNYITVFDNLSAGKMQIPHRSLNHAHMSFLKRDVTIKQQVVQVMEKEFDIVFHLAAVVGVEKYCEGPLKTVDVNFLGTRYIAQEALKHDTKIVFLSTSEVYGKNPNVPFSENDDRVLGPPHIARWAYAASKALSEQLLFAFRQKQGLPIVILRPFNVYGPRQLPPLVVPSFISKVMLGEPPVIYGSGRQTRAFTYVKDLVSAIIAAASCEDAEGEVFNIGSNREVTIYDLAKLIIDLAGQSDNLRPQVISYTTHYGKSYEDTNRRLPCTSKAKRVLGWQHKTDLEEGLMNTIKYWKGL